MTLIEQFLDHYSREYDFYNHAAKLCSERCSSLLKSNGIRAIVTFRPKSIDSLKIKLLKKEKTREFSSLDEIYERIHDLAGVRIALYFPQDKEKITQLLREWFEVLDEKHFPETNLGKNNGEVRETKNLFFGYVAEHCLVRMRESDLAADQKRYSVARVEIQVASVLMHAWAEVEHDLLYKPSAGKPSIEEYETLDQLNGLVLSGEIALKHLQHAIRLRTNKPGQVFRNHYELAAYIYDSLKDSTLKTASGIKAMRSVDVLWKFLQHSNLNEASKIQRYIDLLKNSVINDSVPLNIVRLILDENPELRDLYDKTKMEAADEDQIILN